MPEKRATLLNVDSGSVQQLSRLRGSLSQLGTLYEVSKQDDFNGVLDEILSRKPDVIVLAGGDGTFIRGVEYAHKASYQGVFAVLPLGTANYVARNLGIPLNLEEAIACIEQGKVKTLPLAQVNDNYFMLFLAIGLVQKVSGNISDMLKKRMGQAAYLIELARQSGDNEPFSYKISSPGLPHSLQGESHQLLLYNSDLNVQIPIAPAHAIDDTSLKLVIAETGKSIFKLYLGWLLMIVSAGKLHVFIRTYQLKSAHIRISPQQSADLDGEIIDAESYDVSVGDEKIQVIFQQK